MTSNKTNSARLALLTGALAWCALCPPAHAAAGAKGAPEQTIKLGNIGQGAEVKIRQTINQRDPQMGKALDMLDRKDKEVAQLQGKNQALEAEIRRLREAAALRVVEKAQAPNASAADKGVRDAFVKGDTAPTVASLAQEEATLTKQGKADLAKAAELARQQAVLLKDSDSARALQALRRAATLEPDDLWGLWLLGAAEQTAGNLESAMAAFKKIQTVWESTKTGQQESNTFQEITAYLALEVGDILVKQGNLPAALASFQRSLEIRQRLAAVDTGNAKWQRDLSVSLNKIGDIQQAQGNLPAALASFQRSVEIHQRLAAHDPGNAQWQLDLVVPYFKLARIAQTSKQADQALTWVDKALAILTQLKQQSRLPPAKQGWIGILESLRAELTAK